MDAILTCMTCKLCANAHIDPRNMAPDCKECRNRHFDRALQQVADMAGVPVDQIKNEYFEHLLKWRGN